MDPRAAPRFTHPHPTPPLPLLHPQVLRFMDWMNTNSASLPPWEARTTPYFDSQAGPGGVALEHIVGLCNQLGASPWINVHHLANDTYVALLAQFLRNNLRPNLQVGTCCMVAWCMVGVERQEHKRQEHARCAKI